MSEPSDYPTYDYPPLPEANEFPFEPAGVHRDDEWYDPQGVYRGEYDRTDVIVPPPDPPVYWEQS